MGIYRSLLAKAIRIASVAFEGRLDKGGNPYILHCLHVMNEVKYLGEEAMIVAVLHDLLEDCPEWNAKKLLDEGFEWACVGRVVSLTKEKDQDYMEYIKNLASDKITKTIKKADLRHNSDITRMKGLSQKDFDRLQKYFTAYAYLND